MLSTATAKKFRNFGSKIKKIEADILEYEAYLNKIGVYDKIDYKNLDRIVQARQYLRAASGFLEEVKVDGSSN